MPTKYAGSCHCGDVAFEAEGEIAELLECNCSICSRKGSLLWFIPRGRFRLKTPEENLSTYEFNRHRIHHKFCKRCGIQPFAFATDPKGNAMAAVNARTLEGIDLSAFPRKQFNGRAL
jgi:hypothetical protein